VKSTWVNAYVGLGFLEFHRVTGDQAVLDHAVRTDELLTRHMVDRMTGGYEEVRDRSWTEGSGRKVLCAQVDSLMFVEALRRATGDDEYRARADRLHDILAVRGRDPRRGCALETFDRRWRYDPFPTRDRVSIGHHLKAARLLLEGFARTGNEAWLGAGREPLEFAVRHGWDRRHGGFFHWVFRSGPVARPHKLWWTNAEALPALALMLRIDGGPRYRRLLEDQAAFCFRFFADPEFGEWFAACGPDGRVLDDRKGHPSKAAYHTVEACLSTANHLQEMAARTAAGPTPAPAT